MLVPIAKYGSPILRNQSSVVTVEEDTEEISNNLFDTVQEKHGVGLAAPQIGILKRVFVIDTSLLAEIQEEVKKYRKVFFNPEIIWRSSNEVSFTEGCLSIPGIAEEVMRPEKIKIRYYDKGFNLIEEELNDVYSRIFQHEYDHLDGILFIDKLSHLRRKFLKTKLNEIRNTKNNTLWIKNIQLPKLNYRTLKALFWLYRAKVE